jgi:hypothetical protein
LAAAEKGVRLRIRRARMEPVAGLSEAESGISVPAIRSLNASRNAGKRRATVLRSTDPASIDMVGIVVKAGR